MPALPQGDAAACLHHQAHDHRVERATIVRILSHLGEATDPPRLAAICDRPEAAKAALPPEFELQAFDVPADVMRDDEDKRQDLGW